MAKPCIVKYKGKEYSVEQFSAMLHDGLLNNLIESGAIDQNKLKGDLKLLQDKGISFRLEPGDKFEIGGVEFTVPSEKEQNSNKKKRLNVNVFREKSEKLPVSDLDDVRFNEIILNGNFTVLTGENPQNISFNEEDNAILYDKAKQWLADKKYTFYEVAGMYDGAENSLFVPYMSSEDAKAFLNEFKQESVLTQQGLLYGNGKVNPRTFNDELYNDINKQDNYVSAIKLENGQIKGFKVDINFDTQVDEEVSFRKDNKEWGGFIKNEFINSPEFKDLIGKSVFFNFDIKKLAGLAAFIINPDNMQVGGIWATGKGKNILSRLIINGQGGINFVTFFKAIWANSKEDIADTYVEYIKEMQRLNGGTAYIVLSKGDLSKSLTSHDGAKAAMNILEHFVDLGFISRSDFKKALVAVGRMIETDPESKNFGNPKYGIEFNAKASATELHKEVADKFFGVEDSTFEGRGYFVQDMINYLGQNSKSAKENIEKIRKYLNTEALPLSTKRKTGKIDFGKAGIIDAIGHLLSDSITIGVKNSEAYAVIEITGEVRKVRVPASEGGHSSYIWQIQQFDKDGNKFAPNLYILGKSSNVLNVFNDSKNKTVPTTFIDKSGKEKSGTVKLGSNQVGYSPARFKPADELPNTVNPEEEGPSFRNEELIKPSGFSYEETIKMAGFEDDKDRSDWRDKNRVKQEQQRNPAVQKAAEQYKRGDINQYQMIQAVRENQPIKPFAVVPKIPSFKEIVGSLKLIEQIEAGIVGLTKDIPDGTEVGLRLDIPAYEKYDIWVVSIHDGTGRTNSGKKIAYGKTAVIKNVTFETEIATAALNIATGKTDKTTIARMYGEWVNEDPQSVKERAEKLMNDPAWTQVGMNPFRHSWFYDKANGNPVISADEVIQVGALVLAKNVVMGSITDKVFRTKNDKGEEIFFRKDNKVKGSYFEPAMTTDSKGNYVFFHFSTAPLKSLMKGIDSRRYYSTRTSRDEKGLQYGVASYYTKPTDSENVVGGDKYYVTISPDKVYPMDLDPNGYRAAAEKKIKKNTPFRESKISKEIANAAARDGYEMAVGEWSYDRSGLTKSEIPEFRGDALIPLKPTEITGKEKFKTGEERGIKTEHPDRARLAFNQQVEDLASDIDSYKSSKGKFDDAYEIASTVMVYGGIVEDYGTPNQRVRPLTMEEFDTMTKGLSPKLKQRAEKIRSQMEDMGVSFRVDENYKNNIEKQLGKFDEQINNKNFPSALEVAKYILPKEIFDRYRNLYEMAARNNITIENRKLPEDVLGAWMMGRIQLNKDVSKELMNNYEEFAETLNHEIIHALIFSGVRTRNEYALFNDLQEVMKQVVDRYNSAPKDVQARISLIQEVRKKYTAEDKSSGREIGNLEELITYAFTNTEFAEFLDSIPASKDIDVKGKSIFEQLKNIIRNYINKLVKGPTALDEINSILEKYFDTAQNEQEVAERNRQNNLGLKFNADEISFRIDELWHGTPHKVDKFSTSKIGTGEGVQAFGWGLYFTDLKSIAENYARKLADELFFYDGKPISDKVYDYLFLADDPGFDIKFDGKRIKELAPIAIDKINNEYIPDFKEIQKTSYSEKQRREMPSKIKEAKNVVKELEEIIKSKEITSVLNRNLYKVSLHEGKTADQYDYLLWDKKLTDVQFVKILQGLGITSMANTEKLKEIQKREQEAIKNGDEKLLDKLEEEYFIEAQKVGKQKDSLNKELFSKFGIRGNLLTGEDWYKDLKRYFKSDKKASLFLLENGIDGIKFPAESISRGATSDTARGFNYVVFDENAVSIQEEISFRADMGQRRITSNPRLMAMLYGANFKDLRRAINISPDSFYTPQKYSQLKPQIANMSDAELLAAIDVDTALEDIFRSTDGPIVGLAFIEYINRLKNLIANTTDQNDIDLYEELIQNAYDSVAPFTTKVAQILRQLGEIKSTIKKDEVQFYLDMIESLINANGYMINEDHRDALRGIIEVVLNSKKNYTTLFQDLVNKGSGVTAQDIQDLNMAEVELQNANAALNMIVAFLSPPSSKDFWSGVLRGNLMSVRSALTGLYSNLINMGVFRYRNLVQSVLSIPFAILKKAGINTFGLEKYQFFNTPIVSNIKYGLFLDVLQDAIVGLTKAIATLGKIMIGKESFRGFLDKSPTANRVFNIIKYGSSALEGGSPVILDKSNHTMTAIRKAMTAKGGKTTLNIRGMKMDVASSFKRTSFSKWFKVNYPGSDYNSLSAKDKKIIQDEFFNDPKAAVPTIGDKAAVLGRAFMAVNSEFVFRLVALSDYLPKTYANNIEMTRLAQTLGLDENQTQLFMRDPAKYIEIMSNVLTPEALNFWIDTVAEVTVTKDTGLGKASTAFVEGIKNYVPMKLMRAFPGLSDNKAFINAVGVWQFIIDSIVPFVKIPMNAISLTADFLIPSKPFMKAIYFSALAIKNKGTDQAEAYALSAMKNYSMTVVALGLRSLAVGLVSVPGLVVLAPGKDDDDEKKKMKSKFSRMSINIDALKRYFTPGEDPSYKDGDQYHSLTAYGVLGILIYNYASINDQANKKYYDEISKAPKNLLPSEGITSNPFDMSTSGFLELELKAFEASQFFIDQSWFVGINSALQGLTGGEKGADQFVNNYIGTLLSTWWGFSSHAQQISDMYREITGKPVFDVTLPTELQNVKKEGYPGVFSDRIWNNIFKKNELIHDAIMKSPEDSEYIKFSMYGEKMSPVAGNTKNKLDVALSIAAPARRVTPNLTKEERFYMAVYENKNKINIPGYELSLAEPTMNKTEKLKVFYKVAEFGQVAETINVMIMPKEYNKINEMAGDALRDLHSTLLSEQGLLDFEVRGKVISPEDIMSKNWGNTKEVANVRNAIAVSISEGNKLLNTFLKPWELFSKPVTNYIGKEEAAVIQEVRSLIDTRLLTYKVLNPNTGKMEMLSSYLVTNPELSNKLYNLAKESILLYLKAASEAINKNDKYRELLDNPEMIIEQEKARKEGNF
jgi:hypothetical protein